MNLRVIGSLLLFVFVAFHGSYTLAQQEDQTAQPILAHRVARGDMPLNLIEADDRWVITTNSGWHNAYLQVYDEREHTISGRLDLPSAWYGLAYDPKRKMVLASSAESSLYVIPFDDGRFEAKREMVLDGCILPAGLTLGPNGTVWVACNQNNTLMRADYVNGKVLR